MKIIKYQFSKPSKQQMSWILQLQDPDLKCLNTKETKNKFRTSSKNMLLAGIGFCGVF